jgi:hypothetical protein
MHLLSEDLITPPGLMPTYNFTIKLPKADNATFLRTCQAMAHRDPYHFSPWMKRFDPKLATEQSISITEHADYYDIRFQWIIPGDSSGVSVRFGHSNHAPSTVPIDDNDTTVDVGTEVEGNNIIEMLSPNVWEAFHNAAESFQARAVRLSVDASDHDTYRLTVRLYSQSRADVATA